MTRTLVFVPLVAAITLAVRPQAAAAHGIDVPAGTVIPVRFETTVSSATSRAEDKVLAVVRQDVRVGRRVVIREGSELRGTVVGARSSGRVKGRAWVSVDFDEIRIGDRTYTISTRRVYATAPKTHTRDARMIAGGATAGALIGAAKDGKKGAGVGAVVGAGVGTGAVLATKGKEVTLPAGTRWRVRLARGLDFD